MEKLKGKVIFANSNEEAKAIRDFFAQLGIWVTDGNSSPMYYGVNYFGKVKLSSYELITLEEAKELVKEPLTFPRVMEVSENRKNWYRRVVFAYKQNKYIAFIKAETLEESEKETGTTTWNYAREVQKTTKLTIAEIEERLGIKNLEII